MDLDESKYPLLTIRSGAPALKSTRVNIHMMFHAMKGGYSDEFLAESFGIALEEVAALKAYIAEHSEEVAAADVRIEARIAEERREQAERDRIDPPFWNRDRMARCRDWLNARKAEGTSPPKGEGIAAFLAWEKSQSGTPAEARS